MMPKEYCKGKSGSVHKDAENENESSRALPDVGDTSKYPGSGAALVTTTNDANEAILRPGDDTLRVNVSVDRRGKEFDRNSRLTIKPEADGCTTVETETRSIDFKSTTVSLVDHVADAG
jgi:hypothetical protein